MGWAVAGLLLASLAPLAFRRIGERPTGARHDSFPGAAERRIRRTGKFQRLSRWPSPRVCGSRVGRDRPALGSGPSIHWKSGRWPVPSSPSSRLLPSGLRTGGSWPSMPAAGSRSWMSRAACRKPCAIAERQRGRGRSWNRDGDIIFGNFGGLLRVRERRRPVSPHVARRVAQRGIPSAADISPGRQALRLPRVSPGAPEAGGIYIGTLDAKPEAQSLERLMPYEIGVTYAAATNSGPGRLLFLREGTLIAQPFDERRLALAGEPVPVAERVGAFRDSAFFSVSANDVLVYRSADTDSQLTWFDRQGVVVRPRVGTGRAPRRSAVAGRHSRRRVAHESVGHDQGRPVAVRSDARKRGHAIDIGGGLAEFPVWSPDSTRIVFTFNKSILRQKLASGEGDEGVVTIEQR